MKMKGVKHTLHGEKVDNILDREIAVQTAFNDLLEKMRTVRPHGRNYDPQELRDANKRLSSISDRLRSLKNEFYDEVKATFEVTNQ